MLIFATVAALIPYVTPGFIAFGVGAIAAGWIADKWSREGMMVIFFIGIGASSIVTALADSPLEMALGLLAIGVFAAIYHPVGVAMVVQGRRNTGVPLAINGVSGNLGVAAAALLTGFLIDTGAGATPSSCPAPPRSAWASPTRSSYGRDGGAGPPAARAVRPSSRPGQAPRPSSAGHSYACSRSSCSRPRSAV